ncbi:LytR/AlgR family response regulator transcription factor [Spirosoma linguale]|uniref:LytR/AlgR family response regulator transcription factor n=1 Tax=Spirosoma linguale TaxID=108 RepID=UPI0001A3C9A9
MTNCLVVEDEPLARQVVETYIHQSADLQLVKSCTHTFEAFEALTAYPIDLMFLDIELPSLTGIDFIRQLKQPPALMFTTAYADYAVASYALEAIDYLLKLITHERFRQSIDKFFKRTAPPPAPAAYSYFKVDGQLVKMPHGDILYAQSVKDYILLQTVG